MADATRTEREIETVTVTKEPVIRLELTEAEARTLHAIYAKVGGSPTDSPRKYMDGIGGALRSVLGDYADHAEYPLLRGPSRLFFSDYPAVPEAPRVPRIFRKGDTIPSDVQTVSDGDSFAPHWARNSDGDWKNTQVNITLTESVLFDDYKAVTEVL
jgi:hypothetical protein